MGMVITEEVVVIRGNAGNGVICTRRIAGVDKRRCDRIVSARNRAAAYELALASGRDYKPGEQVSYYITGTTRKVAAYENAKLASAFDPQNRDENIDYYVAKLDELVKKFASVAAAETRQETLLL
jgi:DNA polymerase elongation subunit (family B)